MIILTGPYFTEKNPLPERQDDCNIIKAACCPVAVDMSFMAIVEQEHLVLLLILRPSDIVFHWAQPSHIIIFIELQTLIK